MRWLAPVVLALALGAPLAARAQSPLVEELRTVAREYHKDPASLDRMRAGLEEAARADPRPENLLALAEASFLWGEIRAGSRDQKLEAYDHGRAAAKRAVDARPRDPNAHFWFAINTARWGQVNGVVRSLFLLPTVKEELDRIFELDPGFVRAYAVAGNVYYEVPGLLGGDLARAEALFRKGLELDAHYTALRIGLAKVLAKRGRVDDARRELQAVLDETAPRNPADWTMKDVRDARSLLDSLATRR